MILICFKLVLICGVIPTMLPINAGFLFLLVHWFYLFLMETVVSPFFMFNSLSWVMRLLAGDTF